MRKFNNLQTPITEELLDSMPREEKESLLDSIDSIMFIQNLSDPKRKFAKDLDRWDNPLVPETSDDPDIIPRALDPNGRIVVDLTNPHILEDMDFFRPAAIHFEKHGCYTKYTLTRILTLPITDTGLKRLEDVEKEWLDQVMENGYLVIIIFS